MWDLTDTYRVLGIQDCRTGHHQVCDDGGTVLSEGVVTTIWRAEIRPTRQIRSILIVAHFGTSGADEGNKYRTGVRGAYVTRGCNVISRISADPVLDTLQKSRPRPRKGFSLDGIAYQIDLQSDSPYQIRFSNPIKGSRLHEIQRGLFQIANEIIDGAGNVAGSAAVEIWRRFIDPTSSRKPK